MRMKRFIQSISLMTVALFFIVSCVKKTPIEQSAPLPKEQPKAEATQQPQQRPETTPRVVMQAPQGIQVEKGGEEKYIVLNFDGADIKTVISTIGELLGINYILSPNVSGNVTIQSFKKFPMKDLFSIFQSILEMNGLTAVRDGSLYRIVPIETAKQQPTPVESGKEVKVYLDSSFVTQIIPIQYVKASDAANVLKNFTPRGTDITVYEPNNLLIITAPPQAMARLMKILEAIDISETERESARTFVYYVENGDAKKLADILKTIYVEKKGVAPRPAVTATPIRPLTLPGVQQLPGTTIVSGEVEGEVSITPYEDINAIIIKTTPRNFLTIAETLKKLDILPKQVLIEVMIAEVTLGNSDSMGVEWTLQRALGGHRWGTFGLRGTMPNATGSTAIAPFPVPTITTTNTQTSSTTTSTTTGTNPNLPGLVADVLDSTRLFEVLVNLYGSSNRLNVLASPHILALDNKEAKIEIGSEIPIATGLLQQPATGATATSYAFVAAGQIQYKTVGLLLTVTPHINDKNQVTLKINQEVSSKGADQALAGITSPTFITRKAQTTAVVQNGHTLVLGGLIQESRNTTKAGIPFLSRLPIIGMLFGSTTTSVDRTELLIMVTPHVVSSKEEADRLTNEFQEKVRTIKKRLEDYKEVMRPKDADTKKQ